MWSRVALAMVLAAGLAFLAFQLAPGGIFSTRKVFPASSVEAVPAATCLYLDCPDYRTLREESDFQIRRYKKAVWTATDVIADASFGGATHDGFHRLLRYIQGRNRDSSKIPMTAPVVTTLTPGGGPFGAPAYVVKFFVPPRFAENPPEPDEDLCVSTVTIPEHCAAVRRFPGFASDYNIAVEARRLSDSLERTKWENLTTSLHGRSELFAVAQYNSPFELFNRVNEIWVSFPTDDKGGCQPTALQKSETISVV